MRPLGGLLCLWIGCAQTTRLPSGQDLGDDVLVDSVEEPLAISELPGDPPEEWPLPVAQTAGAYLLPFRNGPSWYVREVRAGAAPVDRQVASGELVGVTGRAHGFAIATHVGSAVSVQLFDGETVERIDFDLGAEPLPGLVSDGERVFVGGSPAIAVAVAPGSSPSSWVASGALVASAGITRVGFRAAAGATTLYGDSAGFVIGGQWLVAADGAIANAPAPQVEGARLYRRSDASGDAVTVDGRSWRMLGGRLRWASADPLGFLLSVEGADGGGGLVELAPDLTPQTTPTLPASALTLGPGWMRGVRGDRALWEALAGDAAAPDHLFAVVERSRLSPRHQRVRVAAPSSRTVIALLGGGEILFAWLDHRVCRYAIWSR